MRAAIADRDAAAVTPLVAVLGGFWTIEGDHLTVLGISRPVLDLLVGGRHSGAGATRTRCAACSWR